jgi:hypothetical protein
MAEIRRRTEEIAQKALERADGDDSDADEMKAAYDWFDEIGWLTPPCVLSPCRTRSACGIGVSGRHHHHTLRLHL